MLGVSVSFILSLAPTTYHLTPAFAQGPTTVAVVDTLYNADGTKASGRLVVSWDYFTAADGTTVDGGTITYTIPASGADAGKIDLDLFANIGATPAGTSYRARYYLASAASYNETWVVPATGPVTIAAIRASVVPTPTVVFNASQLTGILGTLHGGTGLSAIGNAEECLKVNSLGTALEYGGCAPPGSGITMLNGLTTDPQSLAIGMTGTSPGWSSAIATHTLNIPVASAAGVSAGLLSNTDYDLFSGKENVLTFIAPLSRTTNMISCPTCLTSVTAHNLLSSTHGDTAVASPVLGDLLYGNVTPAWTKLAGNTTTTKNFLTQTGTGAVSAAPVWETIEAGDVPNLESLNGTLDVASGGTGAAPGADDQVLVSDSTTAATWRSLPNCNTENMLTYDTASNTFGCESDSGGGGNSFGTIGAAVADAGADTLTVSDGTTIDFTTTDNPEDLTAEVVGNSLTASHIDETGAFAWSSTTNTYVGASYTGPTADPADAGVLRLSNGETICWEASPTGTDFCITGDASERIAATTFVGALVGNADTATSATTAITASTANAGDSATAFFSSGAIEANYGGTGDDTSATTGVPKITGGNWTYDAAFSDLGGSVGDTQITDGAVDGGTGGEIADGSITSADLATANKTIAKSINIFDPSTGDSNKVQIYWPAAVTLARIACSVDTGTVSINFDERAEATPNTAGTNTLSSALVCDTDSQVTTSFNDSGIAIDVPHNLQITATSGTPTIVRIHVKATVN